MSMGQILELVQSELRLVLAVCLYVRIFRSWGRCWKGESESWNLHVMCAGLLLQPGVFVVVRRGQTVYPLSPFRRRKTATKRAGAVVVAAAAAAAAAAAGAVAVAVAVAAAVVVL